MQKERKQNDKYALVLAAGKLLNNIVQASAHIKPEEVRLLGELKCVSGVEKQNNSLDGLKPADFLGTDKVFLSVFLKEFIDIALLDENERTTVLIPASYLAAEFFAKEAGNELIAPDKDEDLKKFAEDLIKLTLRH